MEKSILILLSSVFLFSGCASSKLDIGLVASFNRRLSVIESRLDKLDEIEIKSDSIKLIKDEISAIGVGNELLKKEVEAVRDENDAIRDDIRAIENNIKVTDAIRSNVDEIRKIAMDMAETQATKDSELIRNPVVKIEDKVPLRSRNRRLNDAQKDFVEYMLDALD